MGFPPREVDQMSLWQFSACVEGYVAANGGAPTGLGEDDIARLSAVMDRVGM